MHNYLVTGAGGQLGQCFQLIAVDFPQHHFFFVTRSEVDLNQPKTLSNYYEQFPFEGIINCAGYTKVDQAETESKVAYQINAEGVKNLIAFAEVKKLKLIHFSTDFIFDGRQERFYREIDSPNPLNVYGQSKLAGEILLQKAKCLHTTFRISWLYSPFGKNYVKTILKASELKKELSVVNDQWGKPTYGIDFARVVLSSLEHPDLFGYSTYHFAQGPITNRYELAGKIIALAGGTCLVKPIPSSGYPTAAKRPFNVGFDTNRIEKTLSLPIKNWHEALTNCIKKIKENEVI